MRATLHVVTDSGARRRLEVRGGHVARFGRSEWADFSFPDDAGLADVHFVVECRPTGVVLRDLATGGPVQLNGRPVGEATLRTGDRVTAGRTAWTVEIEGDATDAADGAGEATTGPQVATRSAAEWIELLAYLGVEGAPLEIPRDGQSAEEVVAGLIKAEHFPAAAALRAHQLGPRGAIWWACSTLAPARAAALAAPQRQALDAVHDWIARPDEARRRGCEAQAQRLNYQGPGGMLAAAVFFGGDNIAPPECPTPAPPDPRITGRLVVGHFTLETTADYPAPPADAWRRILARAAELAAAPIAWPEPRPGSAPG